MVNLDIPGVGFINSTSANESVVIFSALSTAHKNEALGNKITLPNTTVSLIIQPFSIYPVTIIESLNGL
jgi:hypothetical protein